MRLIYSSSDNILFPEFQFQITSIYPGYHHCSDWILMRNETFQSICFIGIYLEGNWKAIRVFLMSSKRFSVWKSAFFVDERIWFYRFFNGVIWWNATRVENEMNIWFFKSSLNGLPWLLSTVWGINVVVDLDHIETFILRMSIKLFTSISYYCHNQL